jgi:hypothetical protein
MTNAKDELAALKARVAELERKEAETNKPPPAPFVPQPYEPIDWTARMSMPESAIRAMVAAEPRDFMRDVVRDNRAPTTPATIPSSSQQPTSVRGSNVPGSGTGWAHETPLGPPPGLRYVDAQLDAQDNKDRAELIERDTKLQAMEKMTEQIETMRQQTETLARLTEQTK